jgi:hypothetical protein
MKKAKSGVEEGKGGDSLSQLIDARIEELSDWRAVDAPHRRRAARIAERLRARPDAACQGQAGSRAKRPRYPRIARADHAGRLGPPRRRGLVGEVDRVLRAPAHCFAASRGVGRWTSVQMISSFS